MLTVLTGRRSRKAAAVRAAGRFSLCAQDDSPPYRYVSVQWPVISEEELDSAGGWLAMARRYLGTAAGDRYVTDSPDPEARTARVSDAPGALAQSGSGRGTTCGLVLPACGYRGMRQWPQQR
jgi:hypothetical protein